MSIVVAQVTHGNGTTTDNSYDSLNLLAEVTHKTSGGTVSADYEYTRLADGKISRELLVDSLNPTSYAQAIEEFASGLLVANYVYGLEPLRLENQSISVDDAWIVASAPSQNAEMIM